MYFLIGLLVGFILTLIIYGILVWSFMQLQELSRDLLKKIGEFIYIWNNLYTGSHHYNNYNYNYN